MSSPQGNITFKTLTRPDPSLDFQVLFCPQCNLGPGFTRFLTRCSNAFTIPLRPFCLCRIPSLPHFSNTSVYPAWLTLKTFSPRCLLWSFSFQHPPPSSFPLHPPAHAYPSGCALLQDTSCPIVADVMWLPNEKSGGRWFCGWHSSSTEPCRILSDPFFSPYCETEHLTFRPWSCPTVTACAPNAMSTHNHSEVRKKTPDLSPEDLT